MSELIARTERSAQIEVVVSRCQCVVKGQHPGEPCPTGRVVDFGIVSYWHKNPLRRWAWAIKQAFKGAPE
jgi:hypothetical protein